MDIIAQTGNMHLFIDGTGHFFDADILIIQFLWAAICFVLAFKLGKWTLAKFRLRKRISLLFFPFATVLVLKIEPWIVFQSTYILRSTLYGGEGRSYGFIVWEVPAFLLLSFFLLGYISGIYKPESKTTQQTNQ